MSADNWAAEGEVVVSYSGECTECAANLSFVYTKKIEVD